MDPITAALLKDTIPVKLGEQRDVLVFIEDNVVIPVSALRHDQFKKVEELLAKGNVCFYIDDDGDALNSLKPREFQRLMNIKTLSLEEQLALYQRAGIERKDLFVVNECDPSMRAALEKGTKSKLPDAAVCFKGTETAQVFAQYCADIMSDVLGKVNVVVKEEK